MITSPTTTWLAKPEGDEPVDAATTAYFRARNRRRIHVLILNEFVRSGITQAQLARRCRKRPDVVSRILGEPGNLTINTISDIIFGIKGGELACSVEYPLDAPTRNQKAPSWLGAGQLEIGVQSQTESVRTPTLELVP